MNNNDEYKRKIVLQAISDVTSTDNTDLFKNTLQDSLMVGYENLPEKSKSIVDTEEFIDWSVRMRNRSMKHPVRLSSGHYLYRGFLVYCIGYYPPEGRVCWEALDRDQSGFAHGYTLKESCRWIDIELEQESK
jgi:hypothetical protein